MLDDSLAIRASQVGPCACLSYRNHQLRCERIAPLFLRTRGLLGILPPPIFGTMACVYDVDDQPS
jgi:hypothetical protein